MNKKVISHIERIFNELEIENYSIDDNELSVSSSHATGLKLHIQVNKENLDFYYSVRTSSWTYSGERSDLHDIISVAFSIFLKFADSKISCSLINVINPAVYELDNEIYARYIVPIQYDSSFIGDIEKLKIFCERLVLGMFLFEDLFWRLTFQINQEIKLEELSYSFELTKEFNKCIEGFFDKKAFLNTAIRNFPNWEYIGDTKTGLTIVKSKELAFTFELFLIQLAKTV